MVVRADKIDGMGTPAVKHLRPVRPLHFPCSEPEDEKVPQSRRHHHLCTALYELLRAVVAKEKDTVGADQYVYFQANNPKRCLAPDVFVKLGVPDEDFDSWMAWERGAPDVAFEVLSPSDSYERWTLRQKITRYGVMGVKELFIFNVDAEPGTRLRAWDRVHGNFVERVVKKERTKSAVLSVELYLGAITVTDQQTYPVCLRIRRGAFVPRTDAERAIAAEERERAAEASRRAAEERVATLEAEIARLRGQGAL